MLCNNLRDTVQHFCKFAKQYQKKYYNLIHIYHEYFIKKRRLAFASLLLIIRVWNKQRSEEGKGEGGGEWGGGGGFPVHNLRAKPLLSWIFKNCIENHFGMLGCYFRVKQYIIPLRCLLPSVYVRWKYFRSVSLDSILFSPDINHALEPQFSNKFYL